MSKQVFAEIADLAGVRQRDANQHLDGGRLAGAVRTQQTQNLAAWQVEANRVDGAEGTVAFGQVADFENADRSVYATRPRRMPREERQTTTCGTWSTLIGPMGRRLEDASPMVDERLIVRGGSTISG